MLLRKAAKAKKEEEEEEKEEEEEEEEERGQRPRGLAWLRGVPRATGIGIGIGIGVAIAIAIENGRPQDIRMADTLFDRVHVFSCIVKRSRGSCKVDRGTVRGVPWRREA